MAIGCLRGRLRRGGVVIKGRGRRFEQLNLAGLVLDEDFASSVLLEAFSFSLVDQSDCY